MPKSPRFDGHQVLQRAEQASVRLRTRLGRFGGLVPLASLLWGLVSGWTLNRDYAHSRHLLAALGLFICVSVIARLRQSRVTRTGKPGDLAFGAAMFATRFVVQYVVAFCIPLLAMAGAWTTLTLAVALATVVFSGRLWRRVVTWSWFGPAARCFTMVLATSFSFVVFFPTRLAWFYPALGVVAVLAALPWGSFRRGELLRAPLAFLPALVVALVVGVQATTHAWIRFPPLALWLKRPAIGAGVSGRSLVDRWSPVTTAAKRDAALGAGTEVCCLTPIVSPRGVRARVSHEWWADGKLVERIELPAINGTDDKEGAAFRTYSCKRHFPPAMQQLECRTYLGEGLYLGRAAVAFSP